MSLALDNPSIIEEFMTKIVTTEHFKRDIDIVSVAMKESLIRPWKPFANAVQDNNLSIESRQNAVRILLQIGSDKVIAVLRQQLAAGNDLAVAGEAYQALEKMGAASGIAKPRSAKAERIINEKDDSDLVLVPAGTFLYGSSDEDPEAHTDEKPQQSLNVPDFYIGVYPVTNEKYCRFLNAVKPDDEKLKKWLSLGAIGFLNEKNRLLNWTFALFRALVS